MKAEIRARVDEIGSDNTSGAVQLTRRAADTLISVTEMPELEEAATALVKAQPAMASIFNLSNHVLLNAHTPDEVIAVCREFIGRMTSAAESIARTTASLIQDGTALMTHSYSETVLNALLAAKASGRQFRVIATESRPVREGVALARKLGEAGIPVSLIIDAAIFSFLPEVQMVLVGADAVSSRGVTNKIGTSALALASRTLEKNIYALCGSEKFLPSGRALPAESPKDPTEVASGPLPNTTIWNYYFDLTPLEWFTGVITEEGMVEPASLKQRLGRMQVHPALG